MSRRDWSRARSRDLSNRARRERMDAARYFAELDDKVIRTLLRANGGPATLRCTCGHSASVNTATHHRFRCSQCGRLWCVPTMQRPAP